METKRTFAAWPALVLALAACAHGAPAEPVTTTTTTTEIVGPEPSIATVTTGVRDPDEDPNMVEVDVSLNEATVPPEPERVVERCSDPLVYFELDSAEITPEERAKLDRLAACLVSTEVRVVRVEGHADPRGTDGYNRELARERAEAVETYLREQLGERDVRFDIASHGEERARNEILWDEDRRVDVIVEEGT